MGTPAVSAFPYQRWPRLSRADALRMRRLLRGLRVSSAQSALGQAETLLGTSVRLTPGPAELWTAAEARAALAGARTALWLERRAGARDVSVVVELAAELAAQLVDRVLGGDGALKHAPGGALDELSSGVLAYLAARMATAGGGELRVRGASDAQRAADLLGDQAVLVVPLALALGGRGAGELRVLVAESAAELIAAHAKPLRERALPAGLRAVPLTLCAHAARVTLRKSELAALAVGDVVVPERCALARGERGYTGHVWLHAQGGRGGFRCSAAHSELTIERLDATGEEPMSEGKRIDTQMLEASGDALAAAADAPIELCLELARFTLPLAEISALRPGEVLCTARAIGELVTLSAGGRAFARGELCDVDGEIGVRVTELVR